MTKKERVETLNVFIEHHVGQLKYIVDDFHDQQTLYSDKGTAVEALRRCRDAVEGAILFAELTEDISTADAYILSRKFHESYMNYQFEL